MDKTEGLGKKYYSVQAVAEYFGTSCYKIYKLLETGDMEGIRVSGEWRISKESIDNYESEQSNRRKKAPED